MEANKNSPEVGHFKFTNPRNIKHFVNGSVQFSSLDYFRHLEDRYQKDWIGDRTEGRTTYDGAIEALHGLDNAERKRLQQLGILSSDNNDGTLRIGPVEIQYAHCLIFCFASGEYPKLRDAMCDNQLPHLRYNAAIKIKNIYKLIDKIWQGTVHLDGKTRQVADVFLKESSGWGIVKYGAKGTSLAGTEFLPVTPYLKLPKYTSQSEVRVVLGVPDSRFIDKLSIAIPDPDAVFEVRDADMKLERAAGPPFTAFLDDREAIAKQMISLAAEIQDWWRQQDVERGRDWQRTAPKDHTEVTKQCAKEFGKRVSELAWSARLLANIHVVPFREKFFFPTVLFNNTPTTLRQIAELLRQGASW